MARSAKRHFDTHLILGWVIVVCVSGSILAKPSLRATSRLPIATEAVRSDARVEIPIEREPLFGSIVLRVRVNQTPAVLILDTGSNVTVLSPELVGRDSVELHLADPPAKGSGFVGQGLWATTTLELGTRVWCHRRVLAKDMQDVSRTYRRRVDGLLGVDVLGEFKHVELDFEHHRLILDSRPSQ